MQLAHTAGDVIDNRYRIVRELGRGGTGITYLAESLETGQNVALKELSLRGLKDWKQIELFKREAQTLESLDHPAIPAYVDYFEVDTADNRLFYLAQKLAQGTSLADLVASGWRVDETEAREIATAMLKVLDYLHCLNPPVIHRDIKPQNIIRGQGGRIHLVDFGAVQTVYRDTMSQGSTVVGTYGYMAPEQFRGQAVPATDLYGLGATLLYLLTHQSPADLPQNRLRIDFRRHVSVSDAFADWLDRIIDPLVEDRFASARAALRALTQPSGAAVSRVQERSLAPRRPVGTRVRLHKSQSRLLLEIPAAGIQERALGPGLMALVSNGMFLLLVLSIVSDGPSPLEVLGFLGFLMPLGSLALGMLLVFLNSLFSKARLEIGPQRFVLERQLLICKRQVQGKTADLSGVVLQTAYKENSKSIPAITLFEGLKPHKFGVYLTPVEQNWLVHELDSFIKAIG